MLDIAAIGEAFDAGDVVDITISTTTAAGVANDPDTLVVKVKPHLQETETFTYGVDSELTRISTGAYNLAYEPTFAGRHQVRAETTGEKGAEPGYFDVRPNNTL